MNKEEFLKEYAVKRQNTAAVKWDGLAAKFGRADLMPLWVADTEFKIPKKAQEALVTRVLHGAFGYSLTPEEYYNAYFNWQKQRYGIEMQRDWLRFGTGVVQSLSTCVQFMTQPGDAIMVLQPVYYPFMNVIENNERKLVVSELKNTNGYYEMDFADIKAKIQTNAVKVLILCSPHNPVGRVWSEEELTTLLEICCEEHVLVIADEIHHDLIIDAKKQFVSVLEVKNGLYRDNLVMVDAPSKTFNMAGLIFSHVTIPNPQLRARYDELQQRLAASGGHILGKIAAQAAYEDGSEWLACMNGVIADNFAYLKEKLTEFSTKIVVSNLEGTYLAWIDLNQLVADDSLESFIINDAKLAVDFGDWFGAGGSGHIRINLATTPDNIKKAVTSLLNALQAKQS